MSFQQIFWISQKPALCTAMRMSCGQPSTRVSMCEQPQSRTADSPRHEALTSESGTISESIHLRRKAARNAALDVTSPNRVGLICVNAGPLFLMAGFLLE